MRNRLIPHQAFSPPVPYDRLLIIVVAILISFGLLMVASASIDISAQQLHQPFFYFFRQLISVILGTLMGGIIVQFEIKTWEKMDFFLLISVFVLLLMVLLPGVGHAVNGSARWIGYGSFKIQISELAKLIIVIYFAGYLYRRNAEIRTHLSGFLKPMGILGLMSLLLLCEPDFGATVVIIATALGMMFLAGTRLSHFVFLCIIIAAGLLILAISEPYRLQRLTTFLNPWANPYNSGYQLTQSLIAFGRGGWVGVGLGKSVQKLFYLPEAHTDFLFAVIAEEFGLLGVLTIIGLFLFLVLRIFWIGHQAHQLKRYYAGFMAYGFGLWLAFQFIISVGVNAGMLPTKGLTLPLVSYGGSSMLMNCIVIALLLRIDYENRMILLGLRDG